MPEQQETTPPKFSYTIGEYADEIERQTLFGQREIESMKELAKDSLLGEAWVLGGFHREIPLEGSFEERARAVVRKWAAEQPDPNKIYVLIV